MKRLIKIVALSTLLVMLVSTTCYAATFNFAFTTSGQQVGGSGTRQTVTSNMLLAPQSGNVNSVRYVSVYGKGGGEKITGYGMLSYIGQYVGVPYIKPPYTGTVYLIGTPSSVGANVGGYFSP